VITALSAAGGSRATSRVRIAKIIMVISSHPRSEKMILRRQPLHSKSGVAGQLTGSGAKRSPSTISNACISAGLSSLC
jgi:hypothetical protein